MNANNTHANRTESGEFVDLTIREVVYRGRGLGRRDADGCVVLVPGVAPGERVRVEIVRRHKNYMEGRLIEVIEASDRRVSPFCPLADICPGCSYQHLAYDEEVRIKQEQLAGLLRHRAPDDEAADFSPAVASPADSGYRNKIVLHASTGKAGWRLGYRGEDNRTVVDVAACPLAAGQINERLAALRADGNFTGSLRDGMRITFRCTERDGCLYWKDRTGPGKERLTELTGLGEVHVPRSSFFQVNGPVADRLTESVRDHTMRTPPDVAIDLYCGVGMFALALCRAGIGKAMGIDSDSKAIQAARHNAKRLECAGAEFFATDADEGLREALGRVDAERTALIADPPRTGLAPAVAKTVAERGIRRMIYVSCAADTLARDVRVLREAGFRVVSAQVFDMFPRTAMFESVTVLERAGRR